MNARKAIAPKPAKTIQFCDHDCKFAKFPEQDCYDGSRSCRTFVALYCTQRKMLVHKNLPCKDKVTKKGTESF